MISLLIHRLAHIATLIAAIALLTVGASVWAPGSYDQPLRLEPHYSQGAVSDLRARHGLDRPVLMRVGSWIASAARGDLGISLEYNTPVAPLVMVRAGRTLLLGLVAMAFAWLLAIPIGVAMAARAGSWFDRAIGSCLAVALALPDPVLALGFIVVSIQIGVTPVGGLASARIDDASASAWAADVLAHLALPALVLVIGLLPTLVRHVRSSVVGVLAAPFIVTARARGVPRRRLLFRSALKVAAPPLISLGGLSAAGLFSASLLVEVVTGWPGLGPLLVEATRSRDIPVVIGASVCSMVMLGTATTASDLIARLVDPRLGRMPNHAFRTRYVNR
ncbi:MAG TPA: ABC transporter permease [Vicinamibacterales bacterium]|jgi:peptide/nickel transport system permease protein